MAQSESSVQTSLQQLMLEEQQRRTEQVALAHRRKLETERHLLDQQARRAELERAAAEAAKREADAAAARERAAHERLERERIFELERVRADLELQSRTTLMQAEHQHELERLSIVRDRRVAALEGQRLLLGSSLITLMLGAALLYGLVIRPAASNQEQLISQLTQARVDLRAEQRRETERLQGRVIELDAQINTLGAELTEARRQLAERATKRDTKPVPVGSGTATTTRPPRVERCVDDNDPLCGSLAH